MARPSASISVELATVVAAKLWNEVAGGPPSAPVSSITTVSCSWVRWRMLRTFCSCSLVETKISRAPASPSKWPTCSEVSVVYTGTSTAPSSRQAKSAICHSGRFSLRIATRSPLRMPRCFKALATASTCCRNSRDEISTQRPSRFTLIIRGRSRSTALKKISFRVSSFIQASGQLRLPAPHPQRHRQHRRAGTHDRSTARM